MKLVSIEKIEKNDRKYRIYIRDLVKKGKMPQDTVQSKSNLKDHIIFQFNNFGLISKTNYYNFKRNFNEIQNVYDQACGYKTRSLQRDQSNRKSIRFGKTRQQSVSLTSNKTHEDDTSVCEGEIDVEILPTVKN